MNFKIWEWFTTNWPKLLVKVMGWLTKMDGEEGLSWDDFKANVEWIKQAEFDIGTGAERKDWVMEQISEILQKNLPWVKDLLFSMALNYAKEKGWISLGGSK